SYKGDSSLTWPLLRGSPISFPLPHAAKGLAGLMRQATSLGYFTPYTVSSDEILIGDCFDKNAWGHKRLKIKFNKSNLCGLNMEDANISRLADFLQCKIFSHIFSYLGIHVGINRRRKTTWNSTVNIIKSKISSWNRSQFSFGSRVILINAVLSTIPLYYISFYKAPICIIRSIQKIQRNFLWLNGRRCAHLKIWVASGVKDIHSFNLALLGKWNWRLVNDCEPLVQSVKI
ncbi:hypothetical protein Lal_00031862, partial [Lupinus albus]